MNYHQKSIKLRGCRPPVAFVSLERVALVPIRLPPFRPGDPDLSHDLGLVTPILCAGKLCPRPRTVMFSPFVWNIEIPPGNVQRVVPPKLCARVSKIRRAGTTWGERHCDSSFESLQDGTVRDGEPGAGCAAEVIRNEEVYDACSQPWC
jgi:hypothetical protein